MNKTVLALAIFAFCLFPNVLSQNMRGSADRESGSINLGNIGGIIGQIISEIDGNKNKTTTTTNTTNPTPPANTTSATNTTAPANNSTTTTPAAPANNSTTTTPAAPANNSTTTIPVAPANNSTVVSNNTSSASNSTSATNSTTNTTTTTPPAAPVKHARNDVDMSAFPAKCLVIHNILRAAVNVSALTWSDSIAASAQNWANYMAANNDFQHSGRTGENIASTTSSTKVLDELLDLWTREQNWFIKGCRYPDCSSNGDEVGHYTQMVWARTSEVGCGFAPGANSDWNYLCCQYTVSGNVIGQYVYPYSA